MLVEEAATSEVKISAVLIVAVLCGGNLLIQQTLFGSRLSANSAEKRYPWSSVGATAGVVDIVRKNVQLFHLQH